MPILLLGFAQRSQISWVPVPDLGVLGAVAKSQWFMGSTLFSVVAWLLVVGGVVAIVLTRPARRELLAVLLPWLILPTVGADPGLAARVADLPGSVSRDVGAGDRAARGRRHPEPAADPGAHRPGAGGRGGGRRSAIEQRVPTAKGDWGEVAALVGDAGGDAVYFSTDPFDDEPRGLHHVLPGRRSTGSTTSRSSRAPPKRAPCATGWPRSATAVDELGPGQALITILSDESDAAAADRETLERRGFDETVVGDTGLTTVSRWSRAVRIASGFRPAP